MNIPVCNLSPELTAKELSQIFSAYRELTSVIIIKDEKSGQPSANGFVEMPSGTNAEKASDNYPDSFSSAYLSDQ